ncbi:MAG: hypothetical protein N2166_00080 [candidate division WOR-3 bacterium]|nr:hypothetical protein [candidate division WOR-3 bacterium]
MCNKAPHYFDYLTSEVKLTKTLSNNKIALIILTVGYILSPLSWWNDAFINLPIAYLIATTIALIAPKLFLISFILGYWLTNFLGIFLMYYGTTKILNLNCIAIKNTLIKNLLISVIYTALIVILVKLVKIPQKLF